MLRPPPPIRPPPTSSSRRSLHVTTNTTADDASSMSIISPEPPQPPDEWLEDMQQQERNIRKRATKRRSVQLVHDERMDYILSASENHAYDVYDSDSNIDEEHGDDDTPTYGAIPSYLQRRKIQQHKYLCCWPFLNCTRKHTFTKLRDDDDDDDDVLMTDGDARTRFESMDSDLRSTLLGLRSRSNKVARFGSPLLLTLDCAFLLTAALTCDLLSLQKHSISGILLTMIFSLAGVVLVLRATLYTARMCKPPSPAHTFVRVRTRREHAAKHTHLARALTLGTIAYGAIVFNLIAIVLWSSPSLPRHTIVTSGHFIGLYIVYALLASANLVVAIAHKRLASIVICTNQNRHHSNSWHKTYTTSTKKNKGRYSNNGEDENLIPLGDVTRLVDEDDKTLTQLDQSLVLSDADSNDDDSNDGRLQQQKVQKVQKRQNIHLSKKVIKKSTQKKTEKPAPELARMLSSAALPLPASAATSPRHSYDDDDDDDDNNNNNNNNNNGEQSIDGAELLNRLGAEIGVNINDNQVVMPVRQAPLRRRNSSSTSTNKPIYSTLPVAPLTDMIEEVRSARTREAADTFSDSDPIPSISMFNASAFANIPLPPPLPPSAGPPKDARIAHRTTITTLSINGLTTVAGTLKRIPESVRNVTTLNQVDSHELVNKKESDALVESAFRQASAESIQRPVNTTQSKQRKENRATIMSPFKPLTLSTITTPKTKKLMIEEDNDDDDDDWSQMSHVSDSYDRDEDASESQSEDLTRSMAPAVVKRLANATARTSPVVQALSPRIRRERVRGTNSKQRNV